MATTQTLFDQANSAITGIGTSLITLQQQSDELNVITAAANTTIPTANGNVSASSSTTAYYSKAESDTLYLSTSGGTVTGNITATGFFYANGVSVGGGSGGVAAINGVVDMSAAYSSLILPRGTTAQRPTFAANGAIRWNSSNNWLEVYTGETTQWVTLAYGGQYLITYLIAAGGGGGGSDMGGGGGAGGYLSGTALVTPGLSYTISVGAGGAGAPAGTYQNKGINGNDSTIGRLVITSVGGGGGGSEYGGGPYQAGASGGSGGGAAGGSASGGAGTSGQGYPGGGNGGVWYMGGGGGAGGVGAGSGGVATGGIGIQNSILGTNYYWCGGGGGAGYSVNGGTGGAGGGGGGAVGSPNGGSGITTGATGGGGATVTQANTPGGNAGQYTGGGGGGGSHYNLTNPGGSGGSGIIAITYVGPQRGTGGTITTVSGNPVHTFYSSGTFVA